jgi:hypothetical protein
MTITIIAKGTTEQDALCAVEDAKRMLERHGAVNGADWRPDREVEVKCEMEQG